MFMILFCGDPKRRVEKFYFFFLAEKAVKSTIKREVLYGLLTECHIQSTIDSRWLYCRSRNLTNSFITFCHVRLLLRFCRCQL